MWPMIRLGSTNTSIAEAEIPNRQGCELCGLADKTAALTNGCASDAGCFQELAPTGTYRPVAEFFLIAASCRIRGYWCIGKRGGYGHQRAKDFASWSPHGVRIPINT